MIVPMYIQTNSAQGFPFLNIPTKNYLLCFWLRAQGQDPEQWRHSPGDGESKP